MKILTDEHVSPAVANTLRSEGIDAETIYETPIIGEGDPDVLVFANENGYAVPTNDQDSIIGEFATTLDH
jgi:predicted nuclease of predicted toxin-antitoxin system